MNNPYIIREAIDELDSFESTYSNVIFRNNNLVMPYINLGISEHPLNMNRELMFVDFSYMVFIDVTFLSIHIEKQGRSIIIGDSPKQEINYFGGFYEDYPKKIFNDLEICSNGVYLQILDTSRISKEMWFLKGSPSSQIDMGNPMVNAFFWHEFMPDNIATLIK